MAGAVSEPKQRNGRTATVGDRKEMGLNSRLIGSHLLFRFAKLAYHSRLISWAKATRRETSAGRDFLPWQGSLIERVSARQGSGKRSSP